MNPTAKINLKECGISRMQMACSHSTIDQYDHLPLQINMGHDIVGSWSKGIARVTLKCRLTVQDQEDEEGDTDKEPPFRMEMSYFGEFSFELSEVDDDGKPKEEEQREIKRMLNLNATSIIFPYMRAAVASITAAAGITPLTLPTVNVTTLLGEKAAEFQFDD